MIVFYKVPGNLTRPRAFVDHSTLVFEDPVLPSRCASYYSLG